MERIALEYEAEAIIGWLSADIEKYNVRGNGHGSVQLTAGSRTCLWIANNVLRHMKENISFEGLSQVKNVLNEGKYLDLNTLNYSLENVSNLKKSDKTANIKKIEEAISAMKTYLTLTSTKDELVKLKSEYTKLSPLEEVLGVQ